MRPFKVTPDRASEIERLISLSDESVSAILRELDASELHLEFDEISECISRVIDKDLAGLVTLHVTSLRMLADRPDRSLEEVWTALRDGLASFGWGSDGLERFDGFKRSFLRLAAHRAFYVGAKAASLFRETGTHLHDFRTIVDARPIFDPEREKIDLTVLFTNVAITVSDASEKETHITLALDESELTRIRDECDKALHKLRILQETLRASALKKVYIYGHRAKERP